MTNSPSPLTKRIETAPSPQDFYRAFAVAILTWQAVEERLFRLLYALSDLGDVEQVGRLYYGKHSFGPKLQVVDKVARAALSGADLERWTQLKADLEAGSVDRNWLAHATIVPDFRDDNSFDLVLAPAVFVPLALRQERRRYDTPECDSVTLRFHELADRVAAFTEARYAE